MNFGLLIAISIFATQFAWQIVVHELRGRGSRGDFFPATGSLQEPQISAAQVSGDNASIVSRANKAMAACGDAIAKLRVAKYTSNRPP
jgi:hypothetical protein